MIVRRLGLAIGIAAWAAFALLYGIGLVMKGRADIGRALAYNLPIALMFLVVASSLVVHALRHGLRETLTNHGPALGLWAIGFAVLYLRLVAKTVEVSGHLAWLPLLTVQAWRLGLPAWVVVVGIAATVSAAYLKFAVFKGPSGAPGLIVGLVLALFCAVAARGTRPAGGQ